MSTRDTPFFSKTFLRKLFLWLIFTHSLVRFATAYAATTVSMDNTRPAIVKVHTTEVCDLFRKRMVQWFGTGAIVDKQLGLILTNKHVTGGAGIFKYEVQLCDGTKIEASQVYYDKTNDIAILKVDPQKITYLKELKIATKAPHLAEEVYLVSNNNGKEFSFQTGVISSNADLGSASSSQVLITSLNTKGGSSGAPLLNKNHEVVGLHFASSDTYSIDIHRDYLAYIIDCFKQRKHPIRKTIGAYFDSINISDAVKYLKLPSAFCKQYMKKYPESKGRILCVSHTVKGFPANALLKAGDIIWKVNGALLGPEIKNLDSVINGSTSTNPVLLTVFRDCNFFDIKIQPESLDSHTVKEIIEFGGAYFFEADETTALRIGIPKGAVLFKLSAESGAPITNSIARKYNDKLAFYCFELLEIRGTKINNLSDLKTELNRLKAKEQFSLTYKILGPIYLDNTREDEILSVDFSKPICIADVDISKYGSETLVKNLGKDGQWTNNKLTA